MFSKPKLPSGFKENEQEINRLKFEIEDAISCRNYVLAAQHQRTLNERIERRKQILANERRDSKVADILNLRNQQKEEENQLKSDMRNKASQVLDSARARLDEMEEKHKRQLIELDKKFSDQSFVELRRNPDYYISRKAEEYYSQNCDYQVAAAIKDDLSEKTLQTMENNERIANQVVDSRIESTIFKHEREKKGFKIHLENEKNRLVKETMVEMNRISNKYSKLRQKYVGSAKCDKEGDLERKLREERHSIKQMLDEMFEEFENGITLLGMDPPQPVSARAPQSTRYSFVPRTPRMDSQQLSGVRNPRVVRALEKSLVKRELAVINSAEPLSNVI